MSSLRIPVLLLKTKSTPHDSYEEYLSSPTSSFTSLFVPVLEHKPNTSSLEHVKILLRDGELKRKYGGMIFTSQRAVEGFAQVVQELEGESILAKGAEENGSVEYTDRRLESTQPQLQNSFPANPTRIFPLYTVGPATFRTLTTLLSTSTTILSPLHPEILGSNTGNGEALAKYILEHYRVLFPSPNQSTTSTSPTESSNDVENGNDSEIRQLLPPLLFLVGEQRRDIIPKTLMSPFLAPHQRVQVDELVVYETGVMESFSTDLDRALRISQNQASTTTTEIDVEIGISDPSPSNTVTVDVVVVVIFSPSGCKELLHRLGFLDQSGKAYPRPPSPSQPRPPPSPASSSTSTPTARPNTTAMIASPARKRYIIATIGPTTYNYLQTSFGFEADVCAETPSPEGVGKGIEAFLKGEGLATMTTGREYGRR